MIPFVDLKAQYSSIKGEIDPAVQRILAGGEYSGGSEVARLECEYADYCNVAHAVGVNSGTSALHLALLAAGVSIGDEVITVAFTFVATVAAIVYTGATPILVDINPIDHTIDPKAVEAAISPRTKAIIPVHLHGHPADMHALRALADRHGLALIEDAAQAHGARWRGQRVGSFGDMACFSFYPGKNLGAYGEAGMVVTNNPEHARTLRMLRDWGTENRRDYLLKGYNYRMDALQAAVLRVKLRHIEQWNEARHAHASDYTHLLSGSGVRCPSASEDSVHAWHVYAIRTGRRDDMMRALEAHGITTRIHYRTPVHLMPAYNNLGLTEGALPHTERAAKEILSLPLYPELTDKQRQHVARCVIEVSADHERSS